MEKAALEIAELALVSGISLVEIQRWVDDGMPDVGDGVSYPALSRLATSIYSPGYRTATGLDPWRERIHLAKRVIEWVPEK